MQSPIWIYRSPYWRNLQEVAMTYALPMGSLLKGNRHLHSVSLLDPGDVVFLPVVAGNRAGLRRILPPTAWFEVDHLDQIEPQIASQVRAGASVSIPNDGDDYVTITHSLLQTIMDRCARVHIKSKLNLDTVADALNRSMKLALATNRRREVGFLSQAVIETDYFRTFAEYGTGKGHDYGNYYGRGMHQLTWKETYKACSHALYHDDTLLNDPDLILKDIEVNIKATAWFWRDYKNFNALSDANDVDEIIHKLYGGTMASSKAAVRHSVELRRAYYRIIQMLLNGHNGGRT